MSNVHVHSDFLALMYQVLNLNLVSLRLDASPWPFPQHKCWTSSGFAKYAIQYSWWYFVWSVWQLNQYL